MSGNRYPNASEIEEFAADLESFLRHNFDKEKSDRGQSEKFYNDLKGFMKRYPDGKPEPEPERSIDLEFIKTWLEAYYDKTKVSSDPVWAFNDYDQIYIKDWRPRQIPSAPNGFLGHPRKSKKQRKSRKNTRKSRKNTRNNRKRRT
jgi:hypothetical protein